MRDLFLYNNATNGGDEPPRSIGDAMDMLCVCVEAGQGFDAALVQVARNVKGPIAEEFARVISEIQIGKSRRLFVRSRDRTSTESKVRWGG